MNQSGSIIVGTILLVVLLTIKPFIVEARQPIVLIDEGHGQRFLVGRNGDLDLSGLSDLFKEEGLEVRINRGEITATDLAEADALVISGAFAPLLPAEISAIIEFVRHGGRLCVMLHIGPPLAGLLSKLNVYVSKGIVREQENLIQQQETNFYVTAVRHELMEGIERFKVFGGWALISDKTHAEIIAKTSAKAWLDTNMNGKKDTGETQRPLGLAITGGMGEGSFVIFGDDALFQNQFLSEENLRLGKNLARWLTTGKSRPPAKQVFL